MFPSITGSEKARVNLWGPPHKAKYNLVTDSVQVPWGKGEKNPERGVKEILKFYAYTQSEDLKKSLMTYLLHYDSASYGL